MTVIRVNTATQLKDALSKARSGESIELSPGNYGSLSLSRTDFKGVTLTSSSNSDLAEFNKIDLNGVSNLNFDGLSFKYSSNTGGKEVFRIVNSKDISISDSTLEGRLSSSGFGSGTGLIVRHSSDITLEDSHLSNFYVASGFFFVDDLLMRGNILSGIGHDAANFVQIRDALIEHNTFHDVKAPNAKHQDLIQFWSKDANAPSANITVRSNLFDTDHSTHAIFFGNSEALNGNKDMYWRNIIIENNLIRLGDPNGIRVEHGVGVSIQNNTLEKHPDAGAKKQFTPLITVSTESENVKIIDNVAPAVPALSKAGWTISDNATSGVNFKHWAGRDYNKIIWLDSATDQKASGSAGVRGEVGASGSSSGSWKGSEGSAKHGTQKKTTAEPQATQPETVPEIDLSDVPFDFDGARVTAMGSGSVFRFAPGDRRTSDRVDVLRDLDFDAGDTFRLASYDSGTFRDKKGGNVVWSNKEDTFVIIDSALDLQELVTFSPNISADVDRKTDTLVFRIEQKAFSHTLVMEGMGNAFLEAFQPDLF